MGHFAGIFLKTAMVFFFIMLSYSASGQYNHSIYQNYREINPADSQKLFLRIENANFLNNNEFFGKFVEGYTLIGFHLTPELVYHPTSKIRLKAGAHLLKYYGLDNFSSVIPVFSFQYNLTPSLSLIFGSLYGTSNHRLIEPIYEFERYFIKNQESGIQILYLKPFLFSDTWLNWEKYIFEGDPFQEEFTFGTSNVLNLSGEDRNLQISIPLQATASHKGGQINVVNAPIQTIVNSSAGISFRGLFPESHFKSIEFSQYFLGFNDLSHTRKLPFQNGWASYTNLIAEWRSLIIGAGYWYGDQYITSRGRPVFQSVSVINPGYFEYTRQLITSKILLNKRLGREVKIGLRFETYYDLANRTFDYTYGIHIIYSQRFFLLKTGALQ